MRFIQARNYRKTDGRKISKIVLHSMESQERTDTAENVAAWIAGPSAPETSFHFAVDADSEVQCVRIVDIAWHARGGNADTVGIELAGRASQTREQWLDEYGQRLLERAAVLVAVLCWRYSIPVQYVTSEDLKGGLIRGITTHADISKAFGKSDHTDPGPHFPLERFLARVASVDLRAVQIGEIL